MLRIFSFLHVSYGVQQQFARSDDGFIRGNKIFPGPVLEKGTGYFNLIICLKKWLLPEFLTMKLTGSESRLAGAYCFHRMSYNASV